MEKPLILTSTFRKILILMILLFSGVLFLFAANPAYANHFRSGSMSWERVEGEPNTVLVKVEVGWTNDHGQIPTDTAVGEVVQDVFPLNFGDGNSHSATVRVTSRSTTTNDVRTELVTIKDGDTEYTPGVEHTYAEAGNYRANWGSTSRESAENLDALAWRNETLVNIGGEYGDNNSPVTAVAAVVQVPDNQIFNYNLIGVDKDSDDVQFRYGTQDEFFGNGTSTVATKPTGLELDTDGSVTWDVRDSELSTVIGDRWQMTVMAEDFDSEGNVKSYVPLDFVFRISDSSDLPPTIQTNNDSQSAHFGRTLSFTLDVVDPDWEAGLTSPDVSVVNPPSSDADIWSISNSSSEDTTTTNVQFTPLENMIGDSYVVVFQATDDAGNASTKSISINVLEALATTSGGSGMRLAPRDEQSYEDGMIVRESRESDTADNDDGEDETEPEQEVEEVTVSTSPSCSFTRDLHVGMEGEDVRCLQQSLNWLGFTLAPAGPGSPGEESIYFQGRTFDAVSRFQSMFAEVILVPIGLTESTGYFGPQSRSFLEERLAY